MRPIEFSHLKKVIVVSNENRDVYTLGDKECGGTDFDQKRYSAISRKGKKRHKKDFAMLLYSYHRETGPLYVGL